MRIKYELEYTLNCSQKVLFSRLSTPEGLSEWFADNVTVEGDLFTFYWNKSESKARLAALKENKFVRFQWTDRDDPESNFFEFRIVIDELTGELALLIIDFAYWEFRQTAQRPLNTSNKTLSRDTVEPPHHCTITPIYLSSLYSGPEKERTNKKLTFNKNQVI